MPVFCSSQPHRPFYVEATQDRSIVPAVQRRMQALMPGARRLSIATGHTPQLAQPAVLARLLDDALSSFREASGVSQPIRPVKGMP